MLKNKKLRESNKFQINEIHTKIMKIMKIKEMNLRITKIMKIKEIHTISMQTMKKHRNPLENNVN